MNAEHGGTNRPIQKLVEMANQIADYFESFPEAEAAPGVADHISKFWTPKMVERFLAHMAEGGADLHPLAQSAAKLLHRPPPAPR
ncbi:MAG: formate dehydrogenase subunit delta [Hyphomicrobiales bacterium]|nr:formate dehydrogenase subunit delta [Hyphomicrobiales bacterium]MDE2115573.1 formate dehydrogenase subunit delta [Hyphomicrobiales bacterium]